MGGMRPVEEEGLPEGEPIAVDDAHWAHLKRHFREDTARAAARAAAIRATEEPH